MAINIFTAYSANIKGNYICVYMLHKCKTNYRISRKRHIAIFIAMGILHCTYCIGTKHETQFELRSKLPKLKCIKVCSAFQSTMKIALDTI